MKDKAFYQGLADSLDGANSKERKRIIASCTLNTSEWLEVYNKLHRPMAISMALDAVLKSAQSLADYVAIACQTFGLKELAHQEILKFNIVADEDIALLTQCDSKRLNYLGGYLASHKSSAT